jgi:two-component system sensor histidine kinase TctE
MASHSLRRDLLLRLSVPLLAVVAVAGACAWWLAQHFSQKVLDQWLYDSAITLARQVRLGAVVPDLGLPGPVIAMMEVDPTDSIYYEVETAAGRKVFANAAVPPPPLDPEGVLEPVYYDAMLHGTPVRAIALRAAAGGGELVTVKVAETRNKRASLASEILVATLAIVAILAGSSIVLLAQSVGRSLSTLEPVVRGVRGGKRAFTAIPEGAEVPSEVRPLVRAVNALLADLAQEHAARQRFIADAAHQLRTPLAVLRLQVDLALREADPERRQAALANAAAVLSRTSNVVGRLLTLSRVDQESGEAAALEGVDLGRLAREEVEAWVDRAVARGIDLGWEAPRGPVTVRGKEVLLREALSNLLDNALVHGDGAPVTVGVADDPPSVFVEDAGPGIPEAERERVLGRFYRIAGSKGDGCGLGLPIVDEVARIHGARLRIGARKGGGSRVALEFPRAG